MPRDRAGSFEPRLVGKGQRRLDGIDKIVIGLYARGMTVRYIRAHLIEIYDVEVSPDLISKITDAVLEEVRDWRARPLDRVYPVLFLDALVCKVRTEGVVRNRAAHLAVGIDVDGRKEVLGIWVEATEGAKFWLRVPGSLRKLAWRESWRASTTYSTPRLHPGQPDATRKEALPAIPKRPSSSTTDQ